MSTDKYPVLRVRYFTALVSGLVTVIYFLIGFKFLTVLNANADQTFGIFAGAAYVVGVVLLLASDRSVFLVLGAVLQVFVIYTYFEFASQRTPSFEVWGILLRIAQVIILVALVYLAIHSSETQGRTKLGKD